MMNEITDTKNKENIEANKSAKDTGDKIGPNLKDYKKDYYYFSQKAGDIVRQLAFAGVAVIWIFRVTESDKNIIPDELLYPLGAFCVCLLFDILHYSWSAFIWGAFHRIKESKVLAGELKDEKILAPAWFNLPANILFWGKILIVIFGYTLLITEVLDKICE